MNNDIHHQKIRLTAQTDHYRIAPGNSLEIPLTLTNLGSMQDWLQIGVIGIPQVWVSTRESSLVLQPGEQRQVILTVRPPSPPNAHIGRYNLILRAASIINPACTAQCQVMLTIAGFESRGHVDILLQGLQFTASPGEQVDISVMLISHGLGVDIFQLTVEGLPDDWVTVPVATLRLEPADVREAVLFVQPPRRSTTTPGSYPFRIVIASLEAHHQVARMDCILIVPAFIEFKSSVEAALSHRNLAEQVTIQNFSNTPVAFEVTCSSPSDMIVFKPGESQQIEVAGGGEATLEYIAGPARRVWVGSKKHYPYVVTIQAADGQVQTLEASSIARGLLPVWALVVGGSLLLVICLYLVGMLISLLS